jgi:predicted deacylase
VKLKIQSGFLALIAAANNSDKLTVRVETHQASVNANQPEHAIQAVHNLLTRAGVVKASESIDWEI